MMNPSLDDGQTQRMWFWHFGKSGMFVRLSTMERMEKFDALKAVWLPMDGYYFRRAIEDPFFEEITP
jgi:hypothetical protein